MASALTLCVAHISFRTYAPAAEAAGSKDNLEDLCLPLVFSTPNPICERKYSGNHSMTDKKTVTMQAE